MDSNIFNQLNYMESLQVNIKILKQDAQVLKDLAEGFYKNEIKILSEAEEGIEIALLLETKAETLFTIGRLFERHEEWEWRKSQPLLSKIKVEIPPQLIKLCELLESRPEQIVQAFIHDLAKSVHGTSGSDERWMATDYFLRTYPVGMSTGIEYEEVQQMIEELDELRFAWKNFGNQKENEYQKFFKIELNKWFQKWDKIKKGRRAKYESKNNL